ncbi:hypothetical protein AB0H28_29555 [Micromonospora sp. NPDC050980]|uniref:hypothetical protein n=1 Tax=Micromonospora sp. NPDC050980 TaxID=3155161 RepID=UPI0033C13E46
MKPCHRPKNRPLAALAVLTLLSNLLVMTFGTASPAQAATSTVTCHDGSSSGQTLYTASSDCAKKIAYYKYYYPSYSTLACSVSHSDAPGGSQDTLTVTCGAYTVPPPMGNSAPPNGQNYECYMYGQYARCKGWAEDPDSTGTSVLVDFNLGPSEGRSASRQTTTAAAYGDSTIKAGKH